MQRNTILRLALWALFMTVPDSSTAAAARTATEVYDSLAQVGSEQLMESGRAYFQERQAARSLACFTVVSGRFREGMPTAEAQLCIRAMNNCGCVYKYFYYDYPEAYKYFSQAYDLCEKNNFDAFLPVIMVNLGDLLNDYSINYASQPLSQQARRLFDQAIDHAWKSKNWELLATAFFNLTNQNYDLDLTRYDFIFSEEIPDSTPDLAYIRLQHKGLTLFQQQDYAAARACFTAQLPVVSARWEPERDTLASLLSIAMTYQKEHNYGQALNYLEQGLHMSEELNVADHEAGICRLMSELYGMKGDSAMASAYHVRYLEIKEQNKSGQLQSIGELTYIHQLRKEETRARQMADRQRLQQGALAIAAAVLAVVAGLALLLWRKNRQLLRRNRSLFEKNQQVLRAEAHEHELRRNYEEKLRSMALSDSAKYSHSNLTGEQRETLVYRIEDLMNNADIVCQQDLTLARLAKMADSNTTYVSQVINETYGMTFSNMLGSFRIREACRRMTDTANYGKLTIEAIASSVGFKSRTAFFNAFKRETGLTPSEYQRLAEAGKTR